MLHLIFLKNLKTMKPKASNEKKIIPSMIMPRLLFWLGFSSTTNDVFSKIGRPQITPKPGLELGASELRFIPNMEKLA